MTSYRQCARHVSLIPHTTSEVGIIDSINNERMETEGIQVLKLLEHISIDSRVWLWCIWIWSLTFYLKWWKEETSGGRKKLLVISPSRTFLQQKAVFFGRIGIIISLYDCLPYGRLCITWLYKYYSITAFGLFNLLGCCYHDFISEMRNLRSRETESLLKHHTAAKWQKGVKVITIPLLRL